MRSAILVLGMHRSGTSAITRVLNLLGADVPANLLPADVDNEKGFWESRDLRALHDRLLAACASSYDDVLRLPDEAQRSSEASKIRDEILAVLRRDFAGSDLFVIKDPRISRFVPFWRGILDELGAEARVVLCVRHPLEVAGSLEKRNAFPTAKSLLLWLRHMLDAERTTRDLRRTVVGYDELLADWRTIAARTARELALPLAISARAAAEIDRFVSPRMRHHAADDYAWSSDVGVTAWIREVLAALTSAEGRAALPERLDPIARAFDDVESFWSPVLLDARLDLAEARDQAHQWIARKEAKIVGLEQSLADADAERAQLAASLAAARDAHEASETRLAETERRIDELTHEVACRTRDLASERARVEAQAAELRAPRENLATGGLGRALRETAGWVRRALAGATGRDGARTTPASPLTRLGPHQIIDTLYRCLLVREPDESGRQNHLALLAAGAPVATIVRFFVVSHELEERLRRVLGGVATAAAPRRAVVAAAYAAILGRDAGHAEIEDAAARFPEGTDFTPFLVGLVDSDEFVGHATQPIRFPTVDEIVRVDDGLAFVSGRLSDQGREALLLTLGDNGPHDVVEAECWWESAESGVHQHRYMALVPTRAPLESSPIELRWKARNGRFYGVRGPVPIDDPIVGRRAVLETLRAEGRTNAHLDFVHPAVARLNERCQAKATVRRTFTVGEPAPTPEVSIIVPLYKRLDLVEQQLAQLADDPTLETAELIYVLDSPEQDRQLEDSLQHLYRIYRIPARVIVQATNSGYSAANNTGAFGAAGRLLLLLNSDVFPIRPGWLKELVEFYDATPRIGALGPKLLYEDGSLQHAGMYFSRDHEAAEVWQNSHYFKGFPRRFPKADVARPVPAVTGACMLIDRRLFAELGGFREVYVQGNFEDSDLCLRVLRTGRRNWYLPSVELYHLEGQSFRVEGDAWRETSYAYNCWLHSRTWSADIAAAMSDAASPDGA